MAKPEWGAKRLCPSCGTRFYDLLRDPVPCPNCGSSFALEQLTERKGSASARARPKPEKAAPKAAPVEAEDAELIDDDEDAETPVGPGAVLLDDDEDDSDDGDLGEIGEAAASSDDDDN